MVTPHGIQLAVHLVSCFYGDLSSKVCDCLLRRGTLTLAQIIRFTELSRENVINCLRVLIHQNCVQAFAIQQEGAFQEAPKVITKYMALFDNMIHKMRAPKFMKIVSEELGNDCLGIFQGLIQHGRLSVNQIIDRNEQTQGSSDPQTARECFDRLLTARFVERCPAPEPFLAPPAEEETPAKKRKSSKVSEGQRTTEQRVLEAAAPMESMRFLIDMDSLSEKKGEENGNKVTVGEKRKQDVLRSDEDVLHTNKQKEVLWRVNFEELVRRLRHKACISYVRTRFNDEASIVLGAVLELSRRSDPRQKAEKSAYFSINAIFDEVIKTKDGHRMDVERTAASLEQLGCELSMDGNYSFDITSIIEMAQNEEVESVVLRRYGREAYRIFRLLTQAGRVLETDKISDTTFVEKKDAVRILYKLWQDDYLHMEKVLTSGAKQSMFLLWKVNKQPLFEQIIDEMYHSVLNLRLRITHEQERGKEVVQLPREKLVGELKKKFTRFREGRLILESSLMNLDDAIILFQDF